MNRSAPSTALILGANGRFGTAACTAFAAAGWTVIAQTRPKREHAPLSSAGSPGVRALQADLSDLDTLCAAAHGAQVVIHAVNPLYTAWSRDALPLLRHGMAIAERLGARLMIPGNVYNFGEGMPALLTEDTPQRATTRKGRIRVAMEAELEAAAARGLRSTVLRAGDFFGGGPGTWIDLAIAKSLRRGRLVYPGPLDLPHAWAFLPDLAAAFVALAGRDDLPGFTRLHFAGHTLTGRELLDALQRAAAAIGIAPPSRGYRVSGMPWLAVRAAGLLVPMARELAEMAYLWRVPHALDGRALSAVIGVPPTTPVDTAMRMALQMMATDVRPAGHPSVLLS